MDGWIGSFQAAGDAEDFYVFSLPLRLPSPAHRTHIHALDTSPSRLTCPGLPLGQILSQGGDGGG